MTTAPLLPYDDSGPPTPAGTEAGNTNSPVLLFIHGFLNDAAVWTKVIDELAGQARCVAIDLPGHGRSPGNGAGTYDRDSVLDGIRAVVDHLDIAKAVFVGHSLGGYLSLAMAIEDPERVSGLGLVGAGPGFRNPASREKWNDSVEAIASDRAIPEGMEAISMHVDSMVMDRLTEIAAPVVVVVGERDKAFMASAQVFAKNLNVVSQVVAEGAGHMVHVKGASVVAAALRDAFLDVEVAT